MPYIDQGRRMQLGYGSLDSGSWPANAGELNYILTEIIHNYWLDGTMPNNKQNYQRINDIIGALEGAKAEFQRQVVNPYEDQKIKENGGIY